MAKFEREKVAFVVWMQVFFSIQPGVLSVTDYDPDLSQFAELLALPLAEFAEATKDISPKPCLPGFEPEAFLLMAPHLAKTPVNLLRPQIEAEYPDGKRIFNGWVLLAAEQTKSGN